MSADEKAAYKAQLWQAATDACRAWWAALDKKEREEAIETRARMLWDSYCESVEATLPEWGGAGGLERR